MTAIQIVLTKAELETVDGLINWEVTPRTGQTSFAKPLSSTVSATVLLWNARRIEDDRIQRIQEGDLEDLFWKEGGVVCAKISPKLQRKIRTVMEERHYKTMNDFIEESLMDKIARIEWTRINAEGVKYGS